MWSYFKQNEKVIMVVLLMLLAPTFAFTFSMQSFFTGADEPMYRIAGATYSTGEWLELRANVGDMTRVFYARTRGAYFRGAANDEDTLQHVLYANEAKRLGLAVSDEELREEALEAAKDLICWGEVKDKALPGDNVFLKFFESRPNIVFTQKAYQEALRNSSGLRMTTSQFEETVREILLAEKVRLMVAESVQVPESAVWEEYSVEKHRRILEYVQLPTKDFEAAAKEAAKNDDTRLLAYYEANLNDFKVRTQVDLECFKVDRDKLKEVNPITEEQIKERYVLDRELYRNPKYTRPTEESETPTTQPADGTTSEEGAAVAKDEATEEESTEPEYFPLESKRDDVVAKIVEIREKEILEKIIQAGQDAVAASGGTAAGLPPMDLAALLGDDAALVQVIRTGDFDRRTIGQVDDSVRSYAAFRNTVTDVQEDRMGVGDFGGEPVQPLDKTGTFAYRVASITPEHTPTFEECRDEVVTKGSREFAKDLAIEALAEWKRKVEDGSTTLEDLAKADNREIQTSPALQVRESRDFKVDNRRVGGAREMLEAAFALDEPGQLADPLVGSRATEAVLVRLKEILPADSTDWETSKDSIRGRLEREAQQEALTAFADKLRERSNVVALWEQNQPSAEEAAEEATGG